jgi:glucose/arabinose dehydrogenase
LLYSHDPPGVVPDDTGARVSQLLRVTADAANPNVAATGPDSRVILLGTNSTLANSGNTSYINDGENVACGRGPDYVRDCLPADYDTHSIGTVTFGADGMLYVGNGDASSFTYTDARALRALDLDSMAGKIFRIDPLTGRGLSDNPFYNGDPDANRSKVLNLGLRNPFRFTLHPETNELYIGDVGWNSWEEINVGRGRNFGWPCYEGNHEGSAQQGQYANDGGTAQRCHQLYDEGLSAVQAPAYAYNHGGAGGASANAGALYTGTNYPEQYRGALFIADYNRDWIKYLTFDDAGRATVNDFGEDVAGLGGPAQLIAGPDSNLYYVVLGMTNEVRRIRYVNAANQPPVANLTATPTSGGAPLAVRFSSEGSFDPDAQALSFAWDFGNGATSEQANPTYLYTTPGTFTARLTVTDPAGAAATAEIEIIVGNHRPVVGITSPASGTRYNTGAAISFSGTASDIEDGDLSASIQWKALLHHNEHVHFDFFTFTGARGTFIIPDHGDGTYYELCATVNDSTGAAAATQCIELRPNTVQYTFASVPSGLQVNYAGTTYTTPFTVTTIPASVRELSVAATQNGLDFSGWSDGGARSHDLLIGAGNQTLTATYQTSGGNASELTWTNLVNTTARGGSLRKSQGADDGTFDGRGVSQQTLPAAGSFEFTVSGPVSERVLGLANSPTQNSPDALAFAIYLTESGYAEFREQGVYLSDTPYLNGDIFRIQLADGHAQYFKNGLLQRTGGNTAATAQWQAAAFFNSLDSEIADAKLTGASIGGETCRYSLTPANQTFPAAGGTGTLQVATSAGCAWTAVPNANWLTITSGANGSGSGTLSFRVAANTGLQRTGTLSVAGQHFAVIQSLYVGGSSNPGAVIWTDPVNLTLSGASLQKTRGANDGTWDGSAQSQQTLAGNGFLEFTATGASVYRACALTSSVRLGDPATLDFAAVFTNSDIVEFREQGTYIGDTRFVRGDVFRIEISNGLARYYKNGVLLFTGQRLVAAPLHAAAVFSYWGGEISNARLGTEAADAAP